jgi:cbb3-type cytochrome oxidase subunit 3
MLSQGLTYFNNVPLTVVGMILFFTVFLVVVLWTFGRSRSREFYEKLAEIPLNQDGES